MLALASAPAFAQPRQCIGGECNFHFDASVPADGLPYDGHEVWLTIAPGAPFLYGRISGWQGRMIAYIRQPYGTTATLKARAYRGAVDPLLGEWSDPSEPVLWAGPRLNRDAHPAIGVADFGYFLSSFGSWECGSERLPAGPCPPLSCTQGGPCPPP